MVLKLSMATRGSKPHRARAVRGGGHGDVRQLGGVGLGIHGAVAEDQHAVLAEGPSRA